MGIAFSSLGSPMSRLQVPGAVRSGTMSRIWSSKSDNGYYYLPMVVYKGATKAAPNSARRSGANNGASD
jgi:hypothetical protein